MYVNENSLCIVKIFIIYNLLFIYINSYNLPNKVQITLKGLTLYPNFYFFPSQTLKSSTIFCSEVTNIKY